MQRIAKLRLHFLDRHPECCLVNDASRSDSTPLLGATGHPVASHASGRCFSSLRPCGCMARPSRGVGRAHGGRCRRGAKTMSKRIASDTQATYITDEETILAQAASILAKRLERMGSISDPRSASDFVRMRLGGLQHEVFFAVWLDNRHRVIACEEMFQGTIDGASVHPREVVRASLRHNAAAVIFAHNHPSGVSEPSAADRAITSELCNALKLVGVRVLDHLVVGETVTSMAARGLM